MGKTVREIMEGVENVVSRRKIAANTVEYRLKDGTRKIRLHKVDIVTIQPNGDVILSSGGWKTKTTEERINDFLREYSTPGMLYAHENAWYYRNFLFRDGITIKADGKVKNAGSDYRFNRLNKAINNYALNFSNKLIAGEIPAPSGGDCWICLMKDKNGEPVFESEHLENHVKEGYYVPSLLPNILERKEKYLCGYIMMCMTGRREDVHDNWIRIIQKTVQFNLRRYLKMHLLNGA
jgi:hypothetical protein